MSATERISLAATTSVIRTASLRSTSRLSSPPGWPKAFIARTIVITRSVPSIVSASAVGISSSSSAVPARSAAGPVGAAAPSRW